MHKDLFTMAEDSPAILSDEEETLTESDMDSHDSYSDDDSAFEGSIDSPSYTASVTSCIKEYTYENGRRYHAYRAGQCILPNDEEEQDRMDLAHHIYGLLLGGPLYRAPIKSDIRRVLDIGTGTGIWAMDFADNHPTAQVVGNDLSPIQPAWTAPNCHFEVDDFEAPWSYSPHKKFDLIHGRELEGMISSIPSLFSQAYTHLNPGGWFEMQSIELDFFVEDDEEPDVLCNVNRGNERSNGKDAATTTTAAAGNSKGGRKHVKRAMNCLRWRDLHHEAAEKFGKPMTTIRTWDDEMRAVGLVNVQRDVFMLPFSPWSKDPKLRDIGRYHQLQMYHGINSYTMAPFTRTLGWAPEAVEDLLAKVRTELKDNSLKLYTKVHFVYGQKPIDAAD